MTASGEPPPPFSSRPAPTMRARRCSRHEAREAVARCPVCAGFFCRECIVEHDGQLICASCLARQVANAASSAGHQSTAMFRLRKGATLGLSLLFLWLIFYGFGSLLLRIPSEVHDGTVWNSPRSDANE